MRFRLLLLPLCFCFVLTASAQSAQNDPRAELRHKLAAEIERIARSHDGVLGVAIRDLTTGEEILCNEKLVFPTGSSIKIPVLIEPHKQAAAGGYKLTDRLEVKKQDQVGGSGVIAHFGDGTSSLSLHDLSVLMIVLSDNTATNMLIDKVGMASVNRTLTELGLSEIRLQRKMIDQRASARGDENLATPRAAMQLMEKLWRGEVVSRTLSDEVLAILKIRKDSAIPRAVPLNIDVASKPGGIEGVACDWGLVYVPNRPYAIAVMTSYNSGSADEAITAISKMAYEYFARLARSTEYGARVPLELLKKTTPRP